MPLPPKIVLGLLGLILLLASCGRPEDPSVLVPADVLRCDVNGDPAAAYRQASRELLEAARREPAEARGELVVAYAPSRPFFGARTRGAAAVEVRREFGLVRTRTLGAGRE